MPISGLVTLTRQGLLAQWIGSLFSRLPSSALPRSTSRPPQVIAKNLILALGTHPLPLHRLELDVTLSRPERSFPHPYAALSTLITPVPATLGHILARFLPLEPSNPFRLSLLSLGCHVTYFLLSRGCQGERVAATRPDGPG